MRRSYDELQNGCFDYDNRVKERQAYGDCRYGARGYDYGDASGPQYRREAGDHDRRSDYNYYQQGRVYRGAESLYSCDQNYARDLVRPATMTAKPKALTKAAGKS